MKNLCKKMLAVAVVVLLLCSMMAVGVSAAPDGYTDIGEQETLTVSLTAGQPVQYLRFVPEQDGEYRFYATGEEDTCGVLLDADEEVLYTDDDTGEDLNFEITGYLYAYNVYYLSVSIYDNGSGTFDVTVEPVSDTEFEVDEELTLEDYIIATDIPEGESCMFSFVPEWDGWYRFYTTGDADTYCELWDCNGDWIIFNDNTVDENNCSVTYYLYEGETYYLVVWGYGDATVDYELYIEEASTYDLLPQVDMWEVGDTWTCTTATDADHLYFCFVPEVSGEYRFYTDGDADPYCYFYDADYGDVYYVDDTEDMGSNLWFDYYYDAGSYYYFMLGDWDATTSFSVTLESVYIDPEYPEEPEAIEIAAGETVTVESDSGIYQEFYFVPATDGWYAFTSSGSCDTSITIDVNPIVSNDDDGAGRNFRAVAYCYADCMYSFYTTLFDEEGGIYDVSVNAVADNALFHNVATIKAGDTHTVYQAVGDNSHYYRFVPEVSGIYSLYTTGDADTYCYLYDLEYNEIRHEDDYYYTDDYNCVCTYYFTAGETYYFWLAAYPGMAESVEFDVHLQSGAFGELRAECIYVDETQTVYPTSPDMSQSFAFVPAESDWYRFQMGVDGCFLRCDLLDEVNYETESADNADSRSDFDLVYYCEAGGVYYIHLSTDGEEVPAYTVTVTAADEYNLFPEATDIASGDTKTVYEKQYYRFIPTVTGAYTFYSSGDTDSKCTLYDVVGGRMTNYDDRSYEEEDYNFGFVYPFVAGQVYYFCVSTYDGYEDPYTVTLIFEDTVTVVDHIDIAGVRAPEAGESVYDYYVSLGTLTTDPELVVDDMAILCDGMMMADEDTFEAGVTYTLGVAFDGWEYDIAFANDYTVAVNAGTVSYIDTFDGCGIVYIDFTIPADQPEVLWGDVDGNGKVNNRDLGRLQQFVNDWEVVFDLTAADMDGNGKVNNRDLGLLQKMLNQ